MKIRRPRPPRSPLYWLRRTKEMGRPCGRRDCPRRMAGFSYLCPEHVWEVTEKNAARMRAFAERCGQRPEEAAAAQAAVWRSISDLSSNYSEHMARVRR